jgi:hypothetical protein
LEYERPKIGNKGKEAILLNLQSKISEANSQFYLLPFAYCLLPFLISTSISSLSP